MTNEYLYDKQSIYYETSIVLFQSQPFENQVSIFIRFSRKARTRRENQPQRSLTAIHRSRKGKKRNLICLK